MKENICNPSSKHRANQSREHLSSLNPKSRKITPNAGVEHRSTKISLLLKEKSPIFQTIEDKKTQPNLTGVGSEEQAARDAPESPL